MFGGCHGDYIYVNDLFVFKLDSVVKGEKNVICNSIPLGSNSPSKRWGHSSVAFEDSILIFGGRNEHDLNDLYMFSTVTNEWTKMPESTSTPKPRRRHTASMVGSCMFVFGGFDGNFFEDLHFVNL